MEAGVGGERGVDRAEQRADADFADKLDRVAAGGGEGEGAAEAAVERLSEAELAAVQVEIAAEQHGVLEIGVAAGGGADKRVERRRAAAVHQDGLQG
ncbi:MAG: hypothetical protein ACK55I_14715, partial [bacterium]